MIFIVNKKWSGGSRQPTAETLSVVSPVDYTVEIENDNLKLWWGDEGVQRGFIKNDTSFEPRPGVWYVAAHLFQKTLTKSFAMHGIKLFYGGGRFNIYSDGTCEMVRIGSGRPIIGYWLGHFQT